MLFAVNNPAHDVADIRLRTSKFSGESFLALSAGYASSDFAGKFKREFAGRVHVSEFGRTVSHIVSVGSGEQMTGTKAGRIVAAMENVQAGLQRTMRKLIGESMHEDHAALIFDSAIALFVSGARPLHAGIVIRDFLKQSLQKFKIGNIVVHQRALHWLRCAALEARKRLGAFSILAQEGI